MTIDIASLGLRVDSSQVETANDELLQFTKRADAADSANERLGSGAEKSGKKFEGFSRGVKNALFTLGGIDPRLRAVESLFTRVPLAIFGIAAAVGAVAKAYLDANRESETFARSIALTGNKAGVTTGQLAVMASEMTRFRGTQSEAVKALAAFVQSGVVGTENLKRFARVGADIERDLKVPVEETAKAFAALAERPTEAAEEISKQLNFLTPQMFKFIEAHEKAGDVAGAAQIAQLAYANALEKADREFQESLPRYVRGLNNIEEAASKAKDAGVGLFRGVSKEEQLARLERERGSRALGEIPAGTNPRVAIVLRQQDELERGLRAEVKLRADSAAEAARQYAAALAAIRASEEAKKKQDAIDAEAKAVSGARLTFDVGAIQRNLSAAVSAYDAANEVLEAQREADLVGTRDYYEQKRKLITEQTAVEVKALEDENARLARQGGTTSERIQLQNRIADNETRILTLRRKSSAEIQVLDAREKSGIDATSLAYEDAVKSAQRYVDTLQKRFSIESQGLGRGERERQRLRDRADLADRFEERRQELQDALRRHQIEQDDYDKYLEIEENALKRSEELYDEHFQELTEKQGNWLTGFSEALNNFVDDSQNIAKSFEDLFTNAFRGMTDSLVSFATTGKGNFKGLVNSILADLLRIQLQIIASQALQSIFGGFLSAGGGASSQILSARFGSTRNLAVDFPSGRASGGPVGGGTPYIVGENGPEMFIPNTNGMIAPSGSFGGVNIYSTVNVGAGANVAQFEAALDARDAQLKSDIFSNIKNGRWGRAQ